MVIYTIYLFCITSQIRASTIYFKTAKTEISYDIIIYFFFDMLK